MPGGGAFEGLVPSWIQGQMGTPRKIETSLEGADVLGSQGDSWHPEHGFLGSLDLHCFFHKHSIFP